jgi:hypothetical protein
MLDFLGIGAQKSGTTWVYENLAKHPEVHFPDGKEVHFWDEFYDRGVEWYLTLFPDDNGKKCGEITPAYAILDIKHIKEIYSLNPDLRLFYILRHPAERAWSAALMEMGRAGLTYETASDAWFIEQFKSEDSTQRSDYAQCLKNWHSVFPEEQLLLLPFKEIKENPHRTLQRIAGHIGIDPTFFTEETGNVITERVFSTPDVPFRITLAQTLNAITAPQVERLNNYLNAPWFEEDYTP